MATPALALHERVSGFESRLNRDPLAPGLGRRLTARLYAVAWARGVAQYGGAPVQNVVANRHVELATNGALLREQRAAFGRSDLRGRRALRWATARVGATDLLTAANARHGTARTDQLLAAAKQYQREHPMPGGVASDRDPRRLLRVGVERTADRAFADVVAGENGTGLAELLRSAYTANARLVAAVRRVGRESDPVPRRSRPARTGPFSRARSGRRLRSNPGPDRRRGRRRNGTCSVPSRAESSRPTRWSPNGLGGEVGDGETRSNETRRTVRRWTETFAVGVGVAGDHDSTPGLAPPRPVSRIHERGGALGGPNLRDLPERATEQLVESRGGFDALARRAVTGTLDARPERVAGRRPADLRSWVYRDLAGLRERVRNVSMTVTRRRAVGGEPPTAELARTLRRRHAELVGAPSRYDGVADRARVAARAAYLDRVATRLAARADRANATRTGLRRALADAGGSLDRTRRILRARTTPETPPPRPMPADGPGRAVNLSVAGAPPYLTLAALDHEQVAAIPEGNESYPSRPGTGTSSRFRTVTPRRRSRRPWSGADHRSGPTSGPRRWLSGPRIGRWPSRGTGRSPSRGTGRSRGPSAETSPGVVTPFSLRSRGPSAETSPGVVTPFSLRSRGRCARPESDWSRSWRQRGSTGPRQSAGRQSRRDSRGGTRPPGARWRWRTGRRRKLSPRRWSAVGPRSGDRSRATGCDSGPSWPSSRCASALPVRRGRW
ncbi:DUF7286 family protein [Halorussus caseinilyticus]|uniref:Uncharacterized protein n=1 Tax=Halorussus caseinilyticus TaxID=3034025 RepID=A0ABD5WKD2_9EURY